MSRMDFWDLRIRPFKKGLFFISDLFYQIHLIFKITCSRYPEEGIFRSEKRISVDFVSQSKYPSHNKLHIRYVFVLLYCQD